MVQRDPVQGVILTFVKRWLLFNSPIEIVQIFLTSLRLIEYLNLTVNSPSSKSVTMISDDPLAVGRGRVPLIYNKCLACQAFISQKNWNFNEFSDNIYHDIYSASILCCSSHWLTVSSSTWVNTYLPRKASGAHSFEKTDP